MSEAEPCACAGDPWIRDPAAPEPCPWCGPLDAEANVHGVALAFGARGVLLRGPSGIGKSDLALRLLALGADLVADDRVVLTPDPDDAAGLRLAPAPALAGLIEVSGLGPRVLPHRAGVLLALVVDLVGPGEVERWPAARRVRVCGRAFPALTLAPREASAPLKLALALGIPPWGGKTMPVGCKGEGMSVPVHAPAHAPAHASAPAGTAAPARSGGEPSAAGGTPSTGSEAERRTLRQRPSIVLVTGMSGAGRSTSLKMLEDIGYEAIDNLPLSLLPRLVSADLGRSHAVAVGIDVRTRDFDVAGLLTEIDRLIESERLDARLLFLDCDDEALARRYTETRRRHPLAIDRPVMDGIRHERQRVALLHDRADLVIDTSTLRPADLKRLLAAQFGFDGHGLSIFVSSFSFRQGLPREADLVIDARFLDNPYYDPELRPLTGQDAAVQAHIAADPAFPCFIEGLKSWLGPLLPRYSGEGKSYLTIAVGCTGGRHRSVYAAECLAQWLQSEGWAVTLAHRDISRPLNHLAAAAETASAAGSSTLKENA